MTKEFEHYWVEGENVYFQKNNSKFLVSVYTEFGKELLVTMNRNSCGDECHARLQCLVFSPRNLFPLSGSIYPFHFDSLLPRFLPAQALQSVM